MNLSSPACTEGNGVPHILKVSTKGLITIPSAIRIRFGWSPGDTLVWTALSNGVVIVRRKKVTVPGTASGHLTSARIHKTLKEL